MKTTTHASSSAKAGHSVNTFLSLPPPARRHLLLAALAGSALLGGCVHSPSEPTEPEAAVPSAWEQTRSLEKELQAQEDSIAASQTAQWNAQWWDTFNDPVLSVLIERALRDNLDLRLAAERVLEATAARRGAQAGLFPQFSGSLGAGRSRGASTGTRNTFNAGIEAEWEIDITGRLSAIARAAQAGMALSAAEAEDVRLALLAEVASAYVELRLQSLLLVITHESVRLQEATQTITVERYRAGLASDLDVQRGLSLLAQTRSDAALAVRAAQAARYTLSYLLATTPQELDALVPPSDTLPKADTLAILLSPIEVLEHRPDIRVARARYAAAAADSDAATAARLPRLTIGGLIGLENEKLSDIFEGKQLIWNAAGNLVAPLLDFGRRESAAAAADSRRRQAQIAYEQSVRNALRQVQTAIVSYLQGQARSSELEIAVTAATAAAQIAHLQYEQGILSQLDVIDTEKILHQTRSQWAMASADVSARLIELYRVMGIAPQPVED